MAKAKATATVKAQPRYINKALHELIVPIDSVHLDEDNPQKHGEASIVDITNSLKEFGQRKPIVINQKTNIVIAGNGVLEAARGLGWEYIAASFQTFKNKQHERAFAIVDNLAPRNAEWDVQHVSAVIADIDLLNDPTIGAMMRDLKSDLGITSAYTKEEKQEDEELPVQIDAARKLAKKWKTKTGQIWEISGESGIVHRLMCGNCRDAEDMKALCEADRVNVAVTSPPYASQREYDDESDFEPVHPDSYVDWFEKVQDNVKSHLADDGSFFINIKPPANELDTHLYVFDLVIAHARRWGWHFATEFCWERNGVPKRVVRRFKNQFEPVYQFTVGDWKMRAENVMHASENVPISLGPGSGDTGWKDRQGRSGGCIPSNRKPRKHGKRGGGEENMGKNWQPGEEIGAGMAYPGNRLPSFISTHTATGHTAAFPVGLPEFFIKAYSDAGDVVLDPFGGSGSTLIAAENQHRRALLIEISTAYVAVCLQRFADRGMTCKLIK